MQKFLINLNIFCRSKICIKSYICIVKIYIFFIFWKNCFDCHKNQIRCMSNLPQFCYVKQCYQLSNYAAFSCWKCQSIPKSWHKNTTNKTPNFDLINTKIYCYQCNHNISNRIVTTNMDCVGPVSAALHHFYR